MHKISHLLGGDVSEMYFPRTLYWGTVALESSEVWQSLLEGQEVTGLSGTLGGSLRAQADSLGNPFVYMSALSVGVIKDTGINSYQKNWLLHIAGGKVMNKLCQVASLIPF